MKRSLQSNELISSQDFYDKTGRAYEEVFGHDEGLHRIVQRLLTLLRPNSSEAARARVLDCGCGTGRPVSELCVAAGCEVLGIDWSETMVLTSRQQVPRGTFQQSDMLDFVPPRASSETARFDGIIAMLSLFELSRDQIETMTARFATWLAPGGVLLLGVFGAEDCARLTQDMFEVEGKFCVTHLG